MTAGDRPQLITVPRLDCPIPSALNRHVEDAEEYAVTWATDFGFLDGSADEWGVRAAHIGYLASYSHPTASWPAVQIIVAYLDWLMVYDDSMFDKKANVARLTPAMIGAFHRQILDIMRGSREGDPGNKLHRAMGDIRRQIVRLCPDWDMTDFIEGFGRYLQSNMWEAHNMWSGRSAHLSTYTNMRRHTGCLFPTYLLSAAINGVRLSRDVHRHVALQQLEIMANNYTCWLNDVYSFEREYVDGQVNNLVAVLRQEFDITYQEAAEQALVMCRVEMDSYLELKERLPDLGLPITGELQCYLTVLESWMRALYDWHAMTGRYSLPRS